MTRCYLGLKFCFPCSCACSLLFLNPWTDSQKSIVLPNLIFIVCDVSLCVISGSPVPLVPPLLSLGMIARIPRVKLSGMSPSSQHYCMILTTLCQFCVASLSGFPLFWTCKVSPSFYAFNGNIGWPRGLPILHLKQGFLNFDLIWQRIIHNFSVAFDVER